MYKIAFVIPYFGKLPDYFEEWAYSVSFLSDQEIDFILMTDCNFDLPISNNIKVLKMSFNEFKAKIQEKFNFKISLDSPYKICDYRPAFGFVFEDLLTEYDFWGNTDLDQVWGNFRNFITDDILSENEKVLCLGHCTLYKNNKKMNTMFMRKGGMASYREVFSSSRFYAFDEFSGMVAICKKNGINTYYSIIYADLAVQYQRIKIRNTDNYKKQLVYWNDGHVYRSYIDNYGDVKTDEFLYFHFQKKNPGTLNSLENCPNSFYVQAEKFQKFEITELNESFINKHADYIDDKTDVVDILSYKKNKMVLFVKSNMKDKIIWLKRKWFAESP